MIGKLTKKIDEELKILKDEIFEQEEKQQQQREEEEKEDGDMEIEQRDIVQDLDFENPALLQEVQAR